jgi:hypothetical protein
MAERTCLKCVYVRCDPGEWLRRLAKGEPLVPKCANHPWWPGELHEVPGTPCRNYRPKPPEPSADIKRIPLGHGQYAYVDAADYEWLSQWNWHLYGRGYAVRSAKGKTIFMHREIMKPPKGMVVDHIDGNPRNCYRSNLRICTRTENARNRAKQAGASSQFKGVWWDRRVRKWCVAIQFEHQDIWLGYHNDEVEAARAYDRAAVELFGVFARPNFPDEWPPDRRQEVHAQWLKNNAGKAGKKSKPKGKRGSPRAKPARRNGQHAKRKARRATSMTAKQPARKNTKAKSKAKRR